MLALPLVTLSCLAFARLKNEVSTDQYSVVPGVELVGNNIKVLIDGKSYDTDVLYKISGSCIRSTRIKPVTPIKIVDGKWAGAVVNIKTKNGEVVYMTTLEKENLIKERSGRSTTGFYARVHLINNDGNPFDKAMVNTLRGATDITVKPEDKVGFIIDDVFYNENDIRFINAKKMSLLVANSIVSVSDVKPGEYAKGFTAIFRLETYKQPVADDTMRNKRKTQIKKAYNPEIRSTQKQLEPQTDYATKENDRSTTAAEKQIIAKTLEDPAAPFFNRFHFQRDEGNGFDVIAFKIGNSGGTANLDAGGKAAAFIDGKFYNEDNLKKISAEKAATLSFDYSPDRSKREKIPGDDNYAMPFSFKTKNIAGPQVDTIKKKAKPTPAARPNKPEKPKSTAIPAIRPKKSFLSEKSADHEVLITIDSAADAHNRMLTLEVLKRINYPQFYNRIKFTAFDGKSYDYVACAIGMYLTTAPIKLNAKAGLLIDGIFYDEEAIKKLPESKTQKLEVWYDGLDPKKVPKGYIAALSLRTKSIGQ